MDKYRALEERCLSNPGARTTLGWLRMARWMREKRVSWVVLMILELTVLRDFDEPEEFLTDEGLRVYRVDDPSRYNAVCEVDWFDTPYRKVWFAARRIEMLKA